MSARGVEEGDVVAVFLLVERVVVERGAEATAEPCR